MDVRLEFVIEVPTGNVNYRAVLETVEIPDSLLPIWEIAKVGYWIYLEPNYSPFAGRAYPDYINALMDMCSNQPAYLKPNDNEDKQISLGDFHQALNILATLAKASFKYPKSKIEFTRLQ